MAPTTAAVSNYIGSGGPQAGYTCGTAYVPCDNVACPCFFSSYVVDSTPGLSRGMMHNFPDRISIRDVTDGTSNTLYIGENKIYNGTIGNQYGAWTGACFQETSTATGINNKTVTEGYYQNSHRFASYHVGGAHFLLVDGSVRFISENVSLATLGALGTKSGNEVVGDF
nr:prepilin-type cleavage/methylation domain-containing protein [uncultured bacterium]